MELLTMTASAALIHTYVGVCRCLNNEVQSNVEGVVLA